MSVVRGYELGFKVKAVWHIRIHSHEIPREKQKELVDSFGYITTESCSKPKQNKTKHLSTTLSHSVL